jgi:hypothetical protein
MPLAIQADDVRAAAERILPLARKTPVMTSAGFDAEAATRTFFKCENLQRGGAFKIRGAANMVLSLPRESLSQRRGRLFVRESRTGDGDSRQAYRGAVHDRDARRRAAVQNGSYARQGSTNRHL